MSPWIFSTTRSSATESPAAARRGSLRPGGGGWNQLCRPFSLALLGLSIAVVLWGFGYKLSLYCKATSPLERIPVAKVWIEHRYGFAVAAHVSLERGKPQKDFSRSPLFLTAQPALALEREMLFLAAARPHGAPFLGSPIPLRSPPFFSLA